MTLESIDRVAGGSGRVRADGGELSIDGVFDLLSNRRRRVILYFLADWEDAVGRDELARKVASLETNDDIGEVPTEDFTRVLISLDHIHLPRLVDDGVVEYDRDEGVVVPTDAIARLRPYLDLARSEEDV
ncbi:hypothetical protein ACFQE1_11225 [Halobium palmae]|uniref:DUF7344 domain-containing protein n=1 Tax=Halobium palmae TaxID=1776492 RepID=A0ABD5S122_9EURY